MHFDCVTQASRRPASTSTYTTISSLFHIGDPLHNKISSFPPPIKIGNQISQIFPPSPSFTEASLPDLHGKVYIVTGATAGVGKELASSTRATAPST
jgi:hypothetical protein